MNKKGDAKLLKVLEEIGKVQGVGHCSGYSPENVAAVRESVVQQLHIKKNNFASQLNQRS